MKLFTKNIFPGISIKVSLGLALIVLTAIVSSGMAKYYFDKSTILFQTISKEQLPLLFAASKLTKEVEGLVSDGTELVLIENPLLLESESNKIGKDLIEIQSLISELSAANVGEAPDLLKKSQQILENLQALVSLIKKDIEIDRRILQISIHMRRTSESLLLGTEPQQAALTRRIRELFVQVFSLLRDVPNISDSQSLEEYQSQVLELRKMIDDAMKDGHFKTSQFTIYSSALNNFGVGEKGLMSLANKRLRQKSLIRERLTQNTFLSGELVKQTEQVFSKVSAGIQQQSNKVTGEIEWLGKLFLLIPFVIVVSAILIFLFIRRSVIGRILTLEQSMKAHVKGNPLPIPVEGVDEIASMAQSVSYFIEKRNEYETILQDARLTAEAATRAKSDFLANMSHEIRTPMNAILGFNHLTLQDELSSQQRDYQLKISSAANSLLLIIDDILDLSKIEAGKLTMERRGFSLRKVLDKVFATTETQSMKKGIAFSLRADDPVPDHLSGDALRLEQILLNLASNAIKFTPEGDVSIFVELEVEMEGEVVLRFSIRDTGIGMSPEQIEHLFEPFQQADASITRKYGGTGLGLVISKRLVEMMDGEITVESAPGEGSTFSFTARFGKAEGEEFGEDSHFPMEQIVELLTGVRLLVTEDNEVNLEVARDLLAQVGVETVPARNGREAVERSAHASFDAVLMDMQMPEMDGLTATGEIRKRFSPAELPILAMTANAMPDDRKRCLAAGMNDYIPKPIKPQKLYETILRWVRPDATPRPAPSGPAHPGPLPPALDAFPALAGLDTRAGLKNMNGDAALYEKVLVTVFDHHRDSMARLREMMAGEDDEAARRMAHTLKGVAASIGAKEMQEAASRLEDALKDKDAGPVEAAAIGLSDALETLMRSLEAFSQGKERASAHKAEKDAISGSRGEAPLRQAVEDLAGLIEEGSSRSLEGLGKLKRLVGPEEVAGDIKRLEEQLENYEFEDARDTLNRVAHELNLDS